MRAFPPAQVVWRINGEIVEQSENIKIEFTKPLSHSLTITDAPESFHEATVSLTATNIAGDTSSQSMLSVKGRAPTFVEKPIKCTVLEGKCIWLFCK